MNKNLVKCKDYNGIKNVLFMMSKNDSRVGTENYENLGEGTYNSKERKLLINDKTYHVFSDWSVKEINLTNN